MVVPVATHLGKVVDNNCAGVPVVGSGGAAPTSKEQQVVPVTACVVVVPPFQGLA